MSEAQEMFEKLQRSDEDLYLKIKELQEQLAALHAEVKALRDERETKQEEPPAQASTEFSSEDDSVFDEIIGRLERRSAKAAKRSEMPPYRMKGNMVYLGEYPQSLKESGVTVSDEKDSRGYYLGSDGAYYAEVIGKPNVCGGKFANGEAVRKGKKYYFKVEPIAWRILEQKEGTALLLCDKVIDTRRIDAKACRYADSEIRQWLNGEFLEVAFSKEQRACIRVSTVDNSAASTGSSSNSRACQNTEDAVFLLSHAEARDPAYGFSTGTGADEKRTRNLTDYSAATGSIYYVNGDSFWWLRSPCEKNKSEYQGIQYSGKFLALFDVCGKFGIVPALRIKL